MLKKEYEYRFYKYNKEELVNKILELGGEKVHNYTLYKFTVFNTKDKTYLRLRQENDKIFLTHKIFDDKFPYETQIEVSSYNDSLKLLTLIGHSIKYQFEKLREKYKYKNTEIVFDMYPGAPEYVEIESLNITELDDVCGLLGFDIKHNQFYPLQFIWNKNYGITDKIKNLTFDNIDEKMKPFVKKNVDSFEKLIDFQKKLLI
jgi:adenylate cyclase class IV